MELGSSRSTRPRGIVAVLATLAVAAAGLAAGSAPASSTSSAGDNSCPAAHQGGLVKDQSVHGLTVSSGTTPEPFTGTYVGTLTNGIAAGMDMILVRLTSPEIDRVGGIWQGMSGSPVYDADGALVGAVSYGLSYSPSPIAGLTPAADLEALAGRGGAASATTRSHVPLSPRLQRRLVAEGAATSREAAGGMSRLRLPVVVSGIGRPRDRQRLLATLGSEAGHVVTGASSGAAAAAGPIVPGGNLAASYSSGTVTFAGLGTATLVCGHRVVGFGHPMTYEGRVSLGMHDADVLYVQADALGGSYKVANLGPVIGTVTGDHLAGIVGTTASTPRTATVTARATFRQHTRSGRTQVYYQRYLPDVSAYTLYGISDRAFDHYGPGSTTTAWTIAGTRADGSSFRLHRWDVYLDRNDVSFKAPDELYGELRALRRAGAASIDAVQTSSMMSTNAGRYRIAGLAVRTDGGWHPVPAGHDLRLRAGSTARLRVQLTSATLPNRAVAVRLAVPARAAGASGELALVGGGSIDATLRGSLDDVLAALRTEPHNVDVVADLSLRKASGWTAQQRRTAAAPHVVTGSRGNPVSVVR